MNLDLTFFSHSLSEGQRLLWSFAQSLFGFLSLFLPKQLPLLVRIRCKSIVPLVVFSRLGNCQHNFNNFSAILQSGDL